MTATQYCTTCGQKTTHIYGRTWAEDDSRYVDALRCVVCHRTIEIKIVEKPKTDKG